VHVAAVLTPSTAPEIAGALVAAYRQIMQRDPVQPEEWLYPLAQSALETGNWKSMYNNNVGFLEFGGDTFSLPNASGPFTSYANIGQSALAMMRWLFKRGVMAHAYAVDLPGYIDALQAGNYAGKDPGAYDRYRKAMPSLVKQYSSVVPTPYTEPPMPQTTTTTDNTNVKLAVAGGVIIVGAATLLAFAIASDKTPRRAYARENPARLCPGGSKVQTLLFPRDRFTPSRARAWARSHGYRYGKTDITQNYVRIRQLAPTGFRRMRTISLGHGVRAVVGWRRC
jgi:hypothetical protein